MPQSCGHAGDRLEESLFGAPAEARETIQTIGPLIAAGYSQEEIATILGRSSTWVQERLDELREALLAQAGELEGPLRERVEMLRRSARGTARRNSAA